MSLDFNFPTFNVDNARFKAKSVKGYLRLLMALSREIQQLMAKAPQFADIVPDEYRQALSENQALPLEIVEPLMAQRQASLDQWWQHQSSLRFDSTTLANQLMDLIGLEARLKAACYPEWKLSIDALIDSDNSQDNQVFLIAGEARIRLPGVIAMTNETDASGKFLIYSLASGSWYDSSPERAASQLVQAFTEGSPLRQLLAPEQRAALDQGEMTLAFEPIEIAPHALLINDLQTIQLKSAEKYLAPEVDDARRILRLDQGARLRPMVAGLQKRAVKESRRYRNSLLPEWRRFLEGEELEAYQQLEKDMLERQKSSVELLGQYRNLAQYAASQIQAYVKASLNIDIDPESVQLSVCLADSPDGNTRSVNLLEWVLTGGYSGEGLNVEVAHEFYAQHLGIGFIQGMVSALDIRVNYVQHVRTVYSDESTRSKLVDVVDARIALSLQAAFHQGLEPAAYGLLNNARTGDMQANQISAALVCLNGWDEPLKDLLCVYHDGLYLLYAPGAPGADMQVFNSLAQMALGIGSWTLTPTGSNFLLAQCAAVQRVSLARHLRKVEMLPTDWSMHTVSLSPVETSSWQGVLSALVDRKVAAMIEGQAAMVPAWYLNAGRADQQALADMDQLLKSVHADYASITPMPSFRAYAHQQIKEKINSYPEYTGGVIDPDTVMVETEKDAVRTLTLTVIKGHGIGLNFAESARLWSSVGQDVAHLFPARVEGYMRAAKLGQRYIAKLNSTFLDSTSPDFNLQREWHRRLLGLKIKRDLLCERLQGTLSAEHASWVEATMDMFLHGGPEADCQFHQLKIAGCEIAAAYLLSGADEGLEPLVYLPEVPNGPTFRTLSRLATDWRESELEDYFYDRVALSKQATMGSFIEAQLRAGDGIDAVLDAIGKGERIAELADDFDLRVQRLIDDADEDTTSVAERVSGVVVEWTIVLAGILTIPFPPAAMVVGLLVATKSVVEGTMAWIDGDRAAAFSKFAAGIAGMTVSSGAVTKLLAAAQRYVSALTKAIKLSSSVSTPSSFTRVVSQMVDELADAGGEILPAVYDGFSEELLWMIEDETSALVTAAA